MSALAATGGSPDGGVPSRLIMRLSPIDVKFSPVEMSLLMQLAGWIVLWVYCLHFLGIFNFCFHHAVCCLSEQPCS